MNRRSFLIGGVGVAAVLGGCIGRSPSTDEDGQSTTPKANPTPPEEEARDEPYVVRREFALLDRYPNDAFRGTGKKFRDAATVEFHTETNRIVVLGRVLSGQRSCMKTFLGRAAHVEENALDVVIVDRETDPDGPCSSEVAIVPYRLVVAFENGLPEAVTVEHDSDLHDADFTKTVTSD